MRKILILILLLAVLPSAAQTKRQHKSFRQMISHIDSLRIELRHNADRGRALQWADSLLMSELEQSGMSEKRKLRLMKHYSKVRRHLHKADRRLFWGDSLLAARYNKVKYDTAYISRPGGRWTVKLLENVSGAELKTISMSGGTEHRSKMYADFRATLSASVAYRGLGLSLSVNPAKLAGRSSDFEFNMNSYSNSYGFDVVYLSSKTYSGYRTADGIKTDINRGDISQKALNVNFYYALNGKRFSFPAAFSQSYIQKRSAGSWLLGFSFDGSETKVGNGLMPTSTIRINEFAIGGGYGYNLVAGKHWLFHISSLPTFTVYSHNYIKVSGSSQSSSGEDSHTERTDMKYRFFSPIITGRGAAVYMWRNKFLGATMVFNFSASGNKQHMELHRSKWRMRMFFGFRF